MMTKEQEAELFALRENVNDENIRIKEIIKEQLYNSPEIIHVLETPDLDEDAPAEYVGVSILPFVRIPDIQYQVKNYICFQVDLIEDSYHNNAMKIANVTFVIFCESQNINTKYGIARHDLLAYLVKDIFSWSNIFGNQAKLIYDKESVTDTYYSCRTLKYEIQSPNSIVKANLMNKGRVYNNTVRK